jgi:hypothetical protein
LEAELIEVKKKAESAQTAAKYHYKRTTEDRDQMKSEMQAKISELEAKIKVTEESDLRGLEFVTKYE